MADIGFIGLGNMGAALVRRLMREHTLHVWDLNPAAVEVLVAEGAVAANGPGGIGASGVEMVITCLPTSAQVEEVLFEDDGLVANYNQKEDVALDKPTGLSMDIPSTH